MQPLHISLFVALLLSSLSLFAQAPQSINYQAMAIDGGAIYSNQTFNLRFSILINGNPPTYQEEHFSASTNSSGLFTAKIGLGISTIGTFATIDWSSGPYLLRTEIDPGTGYVVLSEHIFTSVPYALFAERSSLPVADELSFNGDTLQIAQNGATPGQVLRWDGTVWTPATIIGTTITVGPGLNMVGGTIINTGDTDASDDITNSTIAGGDLSGLYPNPNVSGLAGFPLSSQSPGLNQVLKFNGTTWVPSSDNDTDADADPTNEIQSLNLTGNLLTLSNGGGSVNIGSTYNAGQGINIVGGTIINTGDLDPNDDITIGFAAGGDLSGIYPNPTVNGINGFSFANTTPLVGHIYKWNGTQWIPVPDEVDDADADPTNEIQSLAVIGGTISISGGNSVSLPTYFQGTGIDITNNVITNIGDTDASDDITTATSAGGDVSGTFPTLTVDGLQGNPLASTAPASGEVLKWDGTAWTPGPDEPGPWTETAGTAIHDGDIFLQNGSGQTRVAAGITPNDRGYINVYDEFNNLKAGIQINNLGEGEVFGDSKSFRMEHPENPNQEIWYASLEGPEAGAYARGTAELVDGNAVINFPDHFQLIATADNMTIMLTPLSGDSEGLAVIEKTTNGFVVKELRSGNGNYRFDWEAKCIRQGYENFEVIRDRK